MSTDAVQRLRRDQLDAASRTLAEAFHEDPLNRVLMPDEHRRPAVGMWIAGVGIRYGLPFGQVWCNEDASAVAIWLPPEAGGLSMIGMLRAGMGALPVKIGVRRTLKVARLLSATDRFHKSVHGPHWYLMQVGTRPALQGRGLGSRLIEVGTSQADAAGVPCYLETATDSNVAYYGKRGFDVIGEALVDGVMVRGMVRSPASAPGSATGGRAARTDGA